MFLGFAEMACAQVPPDQLKPRLRVRSRRIAEQVGWGYVVEAFEPCSIVIGDEGIEEGVALGMACELVLAFVSGDSGLGLAACQRGMSVGFATATGLVHQLMEARDEKRFPRLGYMPLSPTGAELLFEVFSQRYERSSVLVTSNPPFEEWTSVFGSERLTGALPDRLTRHVDILELNGDS